MIQNIYIEGSEETCYHTIDAEQTEESLFLLAGSYFLNGEKVIELTDYVKLDFPIPEVVTHYQVLICENEIVVLERKDGEFFQEVDNRIDLLAYFTIDPTLTSFDQVKVNYKKVELVS